MSSIVSDIPEIVSMQGTEDSMIGPINTLAEVDDKMLEKPAKKRGRKKKQKRVRNVIKEDMLEVPKHKQSKIRIGPDYQAEIPEFIGFPANEYESSEEETQEETEFVSYPEVYQQILASAGSNVPRSNSVPDDDVWTLADVHDFLIASRKRSIEKVKPDKPSKKRGRKRKVENVLEDQPKSVRRRNAKKIKIEPVTKM